MEHEVPNRYDDITDYEDSDQEDGELPDLPTFFDTNEFASVEDVEMDEDNDTDHSNTEEILEWSPAKDPFLICIEFDDQSSFVLHTIPSSISNEAKREFKIPY
ncbi:hypothetical protein Tco_0333895, partial [Tanacetum coccineum]